SLHLHEQLVPRRLIVTSDRLQLSGTIKSIHFWLALTLALCGSMGAFAQGAATAKPSGRVTDGSGAGIADPRITVTNKGTSLERSIVTSEGGLFSVPFLPSGTYSVKTEHPGFAAAEIPEVILQVGDAIFLTIRMKVGSQTESVTVV